MNTTDKTKRILWSALYSLIFVAFLYFLQAVGPALPIFLAVPIALFVGIFFLLPETPGFFLGFSSFWNGQTDPTADFLMLVLPFLLYWFIFYRILTTRANRKPKIG